MTQIPAEIHLQNPTSTDTVAPVGLPAGNTVEPEPTGKLTVSTIDMSVGTVPARWFVSACFHRVKPNGKYHTNHTYHFVGLASLLRLSRAQRHYLRAIAGGGAR